MTRKRRSRSNKAQANVKDITSTDALDEVLHEASKLDSVEAVREKLRPYYSALVELYEEMLLDPQLADYRSGEETYGYENLETIQLKLNYISDRWRAAFRMRWMIDLVQPAYYPGYRE